MKTYVTNRWILVAGALLLAVLLWGILLTKTASAQTAPTGATAGTPGAMGSHMGYGPGATMWMTGTTGMMGGMMGGYGMGPGTMGMHGMSMHGMGMMAPMAGMMGGRAMGPGMMGGYGMMGMHGMNTTAPMGSMMGGMMGAGGHPCAGLGMSGAMMPGMMAQGTTGTGQLELTVTAEEALTLATEYLATTLPDTQTGDSATQFWGGYAVPVLRDGKQVGMLFVDGFSGQVWSHR